MGASTSGDGYRSGTVKNVALSGIPGKTACVVVQSRITDKDFLAISSTLYPSQPVVPSGTARRLAALDALRRLMAAFMILVNNLALRYVLR